MIAERIEKRLESQSKRKIELKERRIYIQKFDHSNPYDTNAKKDNKKKKKKKSSLENAKPHLILYKKQLIKILEQKIYLIND